LVKPGVADGESVRRGFDGVTHRQRGVRLLVERVGDEGDGSARNKLANEDDPAFSCAVRLGVGDVKAEIYLLEAGVERDGEALDADAVEEEADQRDVAAALIEV
jgi:hypothetical protein